MTTHKNVNNCIRCFVDNEAQGKNQAEFGAVRKAVTCMEVYKNATFHQFSQVTLTVTSHNQQTL
jgi:hypothetical protein